MGNVVFTSFGSRKQTLICWKQTILELALPMALSLLRQLDSLYSCASYYTQTCNIHLEYPHFVECRYDHLMDDGLRWRI